jgi:DNA-binding FadR family transcriptional regulator
VLDTRRLIEITTAGLAAARITTDEVGTLREINELLIAAEDDVDKGFVDNEQFRYRPAARALDDVPLNIRMFARVRG